LRSTRISDGGRISHDFVDPKDGSDIDTSIDIAATIQRIEDNAVLSLVPVFDNDSVIEFFRDEHGRLARRAQGVDHDVIRQDVELFLLFTLDVRLARGTDPGVRV
jgi:hypothetical protein